VNASCRHSNPSILFEICLDVALPVSQQFLDSAILSAETTFRTEHTKIQTKTANSVGLFDKEYAPTIDKSNVSCSSSKHVLQSDSALLSLVQPPFSAA
jgi:hypothetical protein